MWVDEQTYINCLQWWKHIKDYKGTRCKQNTWSWYYISSNDQIIWQIYHSSNIINLKELHQLRNFSNILKKSNVVPVHKKGNKQVVDNYRPVSLWPIFGKILERLVFKLLFVFLHEKNLLNENQSGFRPSDPCKY